HGRFIERSMAEAVEGDLMPVFRRHQRLHDIAPVPERMPTTPYLVVAGVAAPPGVHWAIFAAAIVRHRQVSNDCPGSRDLELVAKREQFPYRRTLPGTIRREELAAHLLLVEVAPGEFCVEREHEVARLTACHVGCSRMR